jgi:hypothetical protein
MISNYLVSSVISNHVELALMILVSSENKIIINHQVSEGVHLFSIQTIQMI